MSEHWFTNETTKLLAENLAHRSKLDELERENAALRETLAIEQERSLYWRSIASRKEVQS